MNVGSDSDVRALRIEELPESVRRFIHAVRRQPPETDPALVAFDGAMGYRVVSAPEGYLLEHPSIRPPIEGDPLIEEVSFDDVCRLLVAELGDRMPWSPGTARYGLPKILTPAKRIDRLRGVSLDRLVAAYLGEPVGVLDRLNEPAALGLLTDELRRRARGHGWTLLPTDGPAGVRLTSGASGDIDLVLRRDGDEYFLLRRGEKQNDLRVLRRTPDLDEAREQLRRHLGGSA